MASPHLVDRFGRRITYLRLSVTDRCDFRCTYCMSEDMTFLPRPQLLTLEELYQVATAFVELGVHKVRITGGEPLVRNGIDKLLANLGRLEGIRDLAITTNGSQLHRLAPTLKAAGVQRLNISLDSLRPDRFQALTRSGRLEQVLAGIDAAIRAGFQRIKLNSVILKGRNDDEVLELVTFARRKGLDISFIEEMPLGAIASHQRSETYCSSDEVRRLIEQRYPLVRSTASTGGPARYYTMADSDSRIGFISPYSHNFCDDCNRVRVTAEGRLILCLGNEHSVDLKAVLRRYPGDRARLKQTIVGALNIKPERHHFSHRDEVQVVRFMNMTGG